MSYLCEEIVEEWLNRKGYFPSVESRLRDEIDILANSSHSQMESMNAAISKLLSQSTRSPTFSKVPKALQKERASGKQRQETGQAQLRQGVAEWIERKFNHEGKVTWATPCPGNWTKRI